MILSILTMLSALLPSPSYAFAGQQLAPPKLILVLVYDQFRADYLTRFQARFLPAISKNGNLGGFRYLMEKGAYFPQAQHGVLQNMTCPGHAAILTGAYPYQNGIALNDWYDSEKQADVYCVEDEKFKTVGADISDLHAGTSPNLLVGTTFGDELKNAGLSSRVMAVALKDRAAILLGGHRADLALWFDAESFRWVSSRFYLPASSLPKWVTELNQTLKRPQAQSTFWKISGAGTGRSSPLPPSSPRQAKSGDASAIYLPFGTQMTVDIAESTISKNRLGNGKDPDVLAISFSTHDILGHFYGPNSREMEELTVSEDAELARLLNFVNQNVPGGLRNALVVLTADHGVDANPEWLTENRVPAGRIDEKAIRTAVENMLVKKFSKPISGTWIVGVHDLNFFLNRRAVQASGVKLRDIEEIVADFIRGLPQSTASIAAVFSSEDVRYRTLPAGQYETQILRTYRSGRSGDIIIIPNPNYVNGHATATHLSGYSYDRTVPMIFAGASIRAGRYSQSAQVIDIAPTLSFLTGVIPPSGSEGRVLSEILK